MPPLPNNIRVRLTKTLRTAKHAPLRDVALSGMVLGFLSHWLVFIRGEHLTGAPRYFVAALTSPSIITLVLIRLLNFPARRALAAAAAGWASYFAALFASMLVYRGWFHPLRNFPGPYWARFSQLWGVLKTASKTDNFRHLDRLHARYGEYVRVGPNLLSVADPELVEAVHNTHTKFTKAECWSFLFSIGSRILCDMIV